jgi:hypothetical protein
LASGLIIRLLRFFRMNKVYSLKKSNLFKQQNHKFPTLHFWVNPKGL